MCVGTTIRGPSFKEGEGAPPPERVCGPHAAKDVRHGPRNAHAGARSRLLPEFDLRASRLSAGHALAFATETHAQACSQNRVRGDLRRSCRETRDDAAQLFERKIEILARVCC